MSLKLKSAKFHDNKLYTDNRTSIAYLEPAADGDDFAANHCVKVADEKDGKRYWGGKLKAVHSGRVWKANLKYHADKCADNRDADQDGGKDPVKGDTTDVSVTIENPPAGTTSTTRTQAVTVLP